MISTGVTCEEASEDREVVEVEKFKVVKEKKVKIIKEDAAFEADAEALAASE
jgi:hypothetical protein